MNTDNLRFERIERRFNKRGNKKVKKEKPYGRSKWNKTRHIKEEFCETDTETETNYESTLYMDHLYQEEYYNTFPILSIYDNIYSIVRLKEGFRLLFDLDIIVFDRHNKLAFKEVEEYIKCILKDIIEEYKNTNKMKYYDLSYYIFHKYRNGWNYNSMVNFKNSVFRYLKDSAFELSPLEIECLFELLIKILDNSLKTDYQSIFLFIIDKMMSMEKEIIRSLFYKYIQKNNVFIDCFHIEHIINYVKK